MPTKLRLPRLLTGLLTMALLFSLAPPCVDASDENASDLEKLGDALQIVLPAGGFLSTFLAGNGEGGRWDKQGTLQSFGAFAGAWTTTYIWKSAAAKLRPNGHARNSFPSGHTMGAFAGATFIDRRYGRWFGIPSYALAALTAYSRVQSDWHFADDTVAGASVSLLWGAAIVTPQPWNTQISPFFGGGATGVLIRLGGTERPAESALAEPANWFYSFSFGGSEFTKNVIAAPATGGTAIDLDTFEKQDDPITTAAATITARVGEKNLIDVFYNPLETRSNGQFPEETLFGGQTFAADSLTQAAWRLHDVRARFRHRISGNRWPLVIGAGLLFQSTYASFVQPGAADTVAASVEDIAFLPFAHAALGYRISNSVTVGLEGDGTVLPEDFMWDVSALVTWRFHPRWEASIGYQYYSREIATEDILNRVDLDTPFATISAAW